MNRWNRNKTRKARNKTAPVQIPPFHYTQSQERRAWTCAIYPHAEVFLKLPGAIRWANYKSSSNSEVTAKFSEQPYYALGGAVEEVYNILYKRDIPASEQLHARVDPTGDLDIRICPMKTNKGMKSYYKYSLYTYEGEEVVFHEWFEHAVNWLVDEIVAYFKPMERELNRMFPTALPFIKEYDNQSRNALRIERVGPLTIIHTTYLQDGGTSPWTGDKMYIPLTKVQIKLTIPMPDIVARAATEGQNRYRYTKDVIQDHMVEFGFWEAPNEVCAHTSFIYRPYNLRLRDLKGEIYGCYAGITQRLELIYHPSLVHKCVNYIYRLRFLLKILYSVWDTIRRNRPTAYGITPYDLEEIGNTLDKLLNHIYEQTRGQKRNTIWFVFYEIAVVIKDPLTDYMDIERFNRRYEWFLDVLYNEQSSELIKTISEGIGSTDQSKIKHELFRMFMNETRARYLFKTPIRCDEATPAEMPQVEAEKKRIASLPSIRGPTLAQLAELPELEKEFLQERRGNRPLRTPGSAA